MGMTAQRGRLTPEPERTTSAAIAGMLAALLTVTCWAAHNVAAKHGMDTGFAGEDLSLLRFGVAGLFLLPPAIVFRRRIFRTISLGRILALSLFGGPVFGLIAVGGYAFAPLSHGLLFAPASVFVTGTALGVIVNGERPGRNHYVGAAVMSVGLVLLSGVDLAEIGRETLIGDAMFVAAGCLWAVFTTLMKRWRIDPLAGTLGVGSSSALLSVPVWFLAGDGVMPDVGLGEIVLQAVMQGLLGGVVAVVALIASVRLIGSSKASLLPSMTPALGAILYGLTVGSWPGAAEITAIALVSSGLVLAGLAPLGHRARL